MSDIEEKEKESPSLSVDDALKMYEEYKSHWEDSYREASIDLKMYQGDPATHYGFGWDDKYAKPSTAMVVDNELPQYVHQVTNDIRQNTPSIKVLPDTDGDEETADVFGERIRAIEYKSCADEAYDTAADYAVKCSIGFIKTDHDYIDDESELQEMQIKSVPDPLTIFNDPATVEWDGRDSNGQIALEPISKKQFEKLYPGRSFISFTDPKNTEARDTIILANIYIREFNGKNGKKATIYHYKFSGEDELAKTTFPGQYVPYTPVYGEMQWIDGKRVLSSLIRQARSPQRRLNHMLSKESQLLAQAPIAPIMAVEGTLVNERKQYQIPGLENALEYRQLDLDGNQAPAPTRLNPPAASSGFLEAIASAKEAIKASMGIYNAGLGKREGDISGIALQKLDQSGDVATFHFPDNVRRSINQVGRSLVEAIPEVEDTARIVQVIDNETNPKMVGINGAKVEGQERTFDLRKGKYQVRVSTGTSYTTKRNEAAALYGDVIKADPALMTVIGDLWAKNLDVAGADAMAARLRKMIPPNLLEEQDQQQIPPQLIQKMQEMQQIIQQGAQEIQSLQAQLDNKQGEQQLKSQELQLKAAELQKPQQGADPVDIAKLQLEKEKDDREYEIKQRELAIKEFEAETKRMQAMQKPTEPQPTGIKLDTTGFQMMKTPEQEAMDAQHADMLAQMEAEESAREDAEALLKAQQADAVINTLGVIAEQLNSLASQAAQPLTVIRDESGAIVGAQ